jgi:hypothetical protein
MIGCMRKAGENCVTRSFILCTFHQIYWDVNDEKNQPDATTVIYYHKLSLHVSGTYMPIFRSTGYNLLHEVFSTVREDKV